MTEKQRKIINLLRANKEPMSKSELLKHFGHWYYYNASKHLGDILSRMVDNNLLYRPSRGYYALGNNATPSNQMSLF